MSFASAAKWIDSYKEVSEMEERVTKDLMAAIQTKHSAVEGK